jgi:DNA-binding IclR family transcriptional regulator
MNATKQNIIPLFRTIMKSLSKAIEIIDAVAKSKSGSAGIRELSTVTGFPPSTIHRIAATLVAEHFFRQNPATKRYSLSFRLLELGSQVQRQFNFISIARPHLEALMAEARESVNLAVQEGDRAVYLDCVHSDHSMLQLFTKPGARVPLYSTAVGKLFLCQMSEGQLDQYLARSQPTIKTPYTRTERDKIIEDLEQIRIQGYAVDDEEMEEGVRCVAALIRSHNGRPVASISISGASMRITPARISYFGNLVKARAATISHELGHKAADQNNDST